MKKMLVCLTALVIFLPLMACASPPPPSAKKTIVVTYSILGSVVKELVGDKFNVIVSIPNGLDPHEWEPSAKDIETINKADLVIQNGLGLEGGLGKTLELAQSQGVKFFTASDYIMVRHVGTGEGIPSGDPDQAVGAADPHLWTDPLAIRGIVNALAVDLKKQFNVDVSAQAASLSSRLDNLNTEIAAAVAVVPPADRKLVTGHESMGYFAQRYGFKLVGVIVPSLSSQAEVSAADLAALKKTVENSGVKAVFTELGTSPAVAKAIGDATGVKVITLATHTIPPDGSYFTFLRNLANVIISGIK